MEKPIPCEMCSACADGYCKDCHQFFCQNCYEIHRKIRALSAHKLTRLEELLTNTDAVPKPEIDLVITAKCPKHSDTLSVFCETCQRLICHNCTVQIHKGHSFGAVVDTFQKQHKILQKKLNAVENMQNDVMRKITGLMKRREEIKEQGKQVIEEINQMIDAVQQSGMRLALEVETAKKSKLQALSNQKITAEMTSCRLKRCSDQVKQNLKMDAHRVLMLKKEMMEQMNNVMEINAEEYNPKEECDIRLVKNIEFNDIGTIIYTSTLSQSELKDNEEAIHIDDKRKAVIPFDPKVNAPIRIIEGLDKPFGVAISNDGYVIVTENAQHCVTMLNGEGKKIKSFTSTNNLEFNYPRGIAITADNFILVTENHKVQKISMDGKLVASIGQEGSSALEFKSPWGIAVSPTTGNIFVVDKSNHRVQVLNPDLTFNFSFGVQGSSEGQFSYPHFVTIECADDQEVIYVGDSHRVQKFTSDGIFLAQLGEAGSDPGNLKYPEGLATSDNYLCVAEWGNNRISVFKTDGTIIRCIDSADQKKYQLNKPHGIAFNKEGILYICDGMNNRLVVY